MLALLLAIAFSFAGTFPTVEVRDLEGTKKTLPEAFEAKNNLVLIGFLREQQDQVDTWWGKREELSKDGVKVYQSALFGPLNSLLKTIIEQAMKSQFETSLERTHIMPIYSEKEVFLESLDVTDTSKILVLLVSPAGEVFWEYRGAATDSALIELRKWLK